MSMVQLRISDAQESRPVAALAFSYKQAGQPSLLRLSYGPPQALRKGQMSPLAAMDSWMHPADDLKLSIEDHSTSSDLPEGLEAQLLRLELLKAHAADIQAEIKATQDRIMVIWKSDFAKCNSISCYVKTAVNKAPKFAHLLALHLSHHSHIDADFFKNSTHMNCTMEVEKVVEQHKQQMVLVDVDGETQIGVDNVEDADSTSDADAAEAQAETEAKESSSTTEEDSTQEEDDAANDLPSGARRPPWRHGPPGWGGRGGRGGRPPWAKPGSRPPWAQGGKPPFGRPPWARPGGRPPWAAQENPTPAASGPTDGQTEHWNHFQPFTLTPQDRFKIAFIIAATFLVGFSAITFACCLCIRRKCILLRDPRRKADCAARREERRTRALYRKAACKHRMRTFFQRLRRPFASADYEEKHEYLLNQEEVEDSDVMRPQINSLRRMHQMLSVMMRARETPSSSSTPAPRDLQAPAELDAASVRSETLPAYSLPPPSYRGGLGSEFSVVTGFTGYTRSTSASASVAAEAEDDRTTESSVVDCTPRLSLDSLRTETTRSRH